MKLPANYSVNTKCKMQTKFPLPYYKLYKCKKKYSQHANVFPKRETLK